MRVTVIEWAVALTVILQAFVGLIGIVTDEGAPKEKAPQTQPAPVTTDDEIKSDW